MMPNRVVREALLDSDRWLGLRDNTARVCYVALLLTADDCGNMEGTNPRLRRLWRDYGPDTTEKVNKVLDELVDADLARAYEVDHKRYLHIPRFGQFIRHIRQRHPSSPWDDISKIQRVAEKTQCDRSADEARTRPEEKRSEVNRSEEKRSSARRGSRLQPGFVPPDSWLEFCKEERKDLDPFETYNSFHDYWTSVPGQKGSKLDWEATWRNWVRAQREARKVR
jgi:hypothetical protein